jgi:sugar O-acyltransferase (sialic acid O-acetyltransferase NeuD family)
MKNNKLVIHASSGHAGVVADVAAACGYEVVAFVDAYTSATSRNGIPVYKTSAEAAPLGGWYFVAIGDNAVRANVVEQVERDWPAVDFATLIHPSASISPYAGIGKGSVVMPHAVANAGCRIGAHAILNTAAVLEHDSSMADFSSLAPRAVTGGKCSIGKYAAIGIGAVIRHGIQVGNDTVIGAAAYLNSDMPDNVVAYGSPARIVRSRHHADRYL